MAGHINLKQLRCFVTVAATLNFRRAAEQLFMTQPPLSRQIQALEARLGAALFTRDRSSVALTPFGADFLAKARALLAQSDALANARPDAGNMGTVLRVGVTPVLNPDSFALIGPRFERAYPGCRVDFKRQWSIRCIRDVGRGLLDAALIGLPADTAGLPFQRLSDDPLVVAMQATHRLARKRGVALADLRDDVLYWFERKRNPAYYDRCQAVFDDCGFHPARAAEPQEHHVLLGLIAAQGGIALIPTSLTTIRRDGVVYKTLREADEFGVGFGVVWVDAAPSEAVRVFIGMLAAMA